MVLIQLKSVPVQLAILYMFAVVWATANTNEDIDFPIQDFMDIEDSTDPSEEVNDEDSENKTIFLTRREACDFLGIGDMFQNPKHHMDLAYEYLGMEEANYWTVRCEEKKVHGSETDQLGYCA